MLSTALRLLTLLSLPFLFIIAGCIESSDKAPICTAGERRCSPSSNEVEQCVGGESWAPYLTCEQNERCSNALCETISATCGNGVCNLPDETCNSCPEDCGVCCGNGKCEVIYNEDPTTCSADCHTTEMGVADQSIEQSLCPATGELFCDGSCVNVTSNSTHCGACNTPCWGLCVQGECPGKPIALALSQWHSCALRQSGKVACWGYNAEGELGVGTRADSALPLSTLGISDAVEITAGASHTCVRKSTGQIACWGDNEKGQLGNASTLTSAIPVNVAAPSAMKAISAGGNHSCGIDPGGTVYCWGTNFFGQLGDGTQDSSSSIPVATSITDAIAIAAGSNHTCALHTDRTVSCWGRNVEGQLGVEEPYFDSPTPIKTSVSDIVQIASGWSLTCALNGKDELYCWGDGTYGQLGPTISDSTFRPTKIALTDIKKIFAKAESLCALLNSGEVSCWGRNVEGQFGNGTLSDDPQPTPTKVFGLTEVTTLSLGVVHACALTSSGRIFCWGLNEFGELGNGTQTDSSVPTETTRPTD